MKNNYHKVKNYKKPEIVTDIEPLMGRQVINPEVADVIEPETIDPETIELINDKTDIVDVIEPDDNLSTYKKQLRMKVINCDALSLRKSPSKTSKVMGVILKDDIVFFENAVDDEWVEITTNNNIKAFVMSYYIEVV